MNLQEVITMMVSLFSQERIDEMLKNEIMAQGIGRGSFNMLAVLVKDGIVSKEYAADKLGISVEEFDRRVLAIRD